MIAFLWFIAIVRVTFALPGMALRGVGLGYKKTFRLANLTIERPAHFKSKAQMAAFENVGEYISSAMTLNEMISFEDSSLRGESFLRPNGVSLDIWHEVLNYFKEQGAIEERWRVEIPYHLQPRSYDRSPFDPYQIRQRPAH